MLTKDEWGDEAELGVELVFEQADALSKAQLETLPMTTILIASIAGVAMDINAPLPAIGWVVIMLVIYFFRYTMSKTYQAQNEKKSRNARLYLRRALVGGICSGIGFAFVPAFFIGTEIDQALPLIVVLMGITSGSVVHCAAYKQLSMVINIPIVLTAAYKILEMSNTYHAMMCFDILLYLLFLLVTASRLEAGFICRVRITAKAVQLAGNYPPPI